MHENKQNISLKDAGKELPFTVPENYFEDFAVRITAQTSDRHVPFRKVLKPWLYMAGLFAGVFLLGNIAYAIYQRSTNLKIENYERYLLSQVDEAALIDFYLEEFNEEY